MPPIDPADPFPPVLFDRQTVLSRPCPVPDVPGVYGWWFREPPPGVPLDGCLTRMGMALLYVGISPKETREGLPPSRQTLRKRIRYHYRGNAYGSTLRLTLGCLLGYRLRVVGTGRLTFGEEEHELSEWMNQSALVTWIPCEKPWIVEREFIGSISVPLNLRDNRHHGFHPTLTEARFRARRAALNLG